MTLPGTVMIYRLGCQWQQECGHIVYLRFSTAVFPILPCSEVPHPSRQPPQASPVLSSVHYTNTISGIYAW